MNTYTIKGEAQINFQISVDAETEEEAENFAQGELDSAISMDGDFDMVCFQIISVTEEQE